LALTLPHPENVATKALAFILGKSEKARNAFSALMNQYGLGLPTIRTYRTQELGSEGKTVLDLVGLDENGEEVLLIEGKFWAGLMDTQPCGYLGRLKGKAGALLFVAPDKRSGSLWDEIKRRGKDRIAREIETAGAKVARLRDGHYLALTNWRAVLHSLVEALQAVGETKTASDVHQLQGLCDSQDSEAFLPLRSEELAPEIPRRFVQLCQLVDKAAETAVKEKFASKKWAGKGKLLRSVTLGVYGSYLLFGDVGVILSVHCRAWMTTGATPLWLGICGTDWKRASIPKLREQLKAIEIEGPFFDDKQDETLCVPLRLPLGVEEDLVCKQVVAQMKKIAGRLKGK
jgi:hypothetical protein